MGLDEFVSDSSSSSSSDSSKDNQQQNENSEVTTFGDRETDSEYKTVTNNKSEFTHPAQDHTRDTEYSSDLFRECWLCSSRMARIDELSQLGDVWFCETNDCRNSVKHKVENEARCKDLAQKVNSDRIQNILSDDDLEPDSLVLEDSIPGQYVLIDLSS